MVYGLVSTHVHPSPRAVSETISGTPGKSMRIEIGPDPRWTRPVASTAFPFVYWTFQVLERHASLDLETRMSPVLERFATDVAQQAMDVDLRTLMAASQGRVPGGGKRRGTR